MKETSYWIDTYKHPTLYPSLNETIHTDILIIGAGITGLTCAYYLTKQCQQRVVIVESDRVGYGASGRSTGKVSAQHGLIYHSLIEKIGYDKANLYYQAQIHAIQEIEEICKSHHIACNFERKDTMIYAETSVGKQALQDEYQAYLDLHIPCTFLDDHQFSQGKAALIMHEQATFQPYAYLQGLANIITKQKGIIYEQSSVQEVLKQENNIYQVLCNSHHIYAKNVVLATQIPILDHGHLFVTNMHCDQEHIHTASNILKPVCLQIDASKYSFHTVEDTTLFVHGNHKSGVNALDPSSLLQEAMDILQTKQLTYHWSSSDYTTFDMIPMIGPLDKNNDHIVFATGYGKWGNTNGHVAGKLLCAYLLQKPSKYCDIFSPHRKKSMFSFSYVKENLQNASSFMKGHLQIPDSELPKPLEGKKITIQNHTYGAYREQDGTLYIVDITCPHLGCICNFNEVDKTWDCPCHGSRYSYQGILRRGPSTSNLHTFNETKNKVDPHIFEPK